MSHLQAAAQEGATRPPDLDEVVALHFVALVGREGRLLELDGRKPFPIDHGATSPDTLLQVSSQPRVVGFGSAGLTHVRVSACKALISYWNFQQCCGRAGRYP